MSYLIPNEFYYLNYIENLELVLTNEQFQEITIINQNITVLEAKKSVYGIKIADEYEKKSQYDKLMYDIDNDTENIALKLSIKTNLINIQLLYDESIDKLNKEKINILDTINSENEKIKSLKHLRFKNLLNYINNIDTITMNDTIIKLLIKDEKIESQYNTITLKFMIGFFKYIFKYRDDLHYFMSNYLPIGTLYLSHLKGKKLCSLQKMLLSTYHEMNENEKLEFLFILNDYLLIKTSFSLKNNIIKFMDNKINPTQWS